MFGFLEPNGAGKSTTLRLPLGLIHPSAGSASIMGVARKRRRGRRSTFLGPATGLPDGIIELSPFAHIAFVPAETVDWPGVIIISFVGVLLAGVGFAGYQRRDLR